MVFLKCKKELHLNRNSFWNFKNTIKKTDVIYLTNVLIYTTKMNELPMFAWTLYCIKISETKTFILYDFMFKIYIQE